MTHRMSWEEYALSLARVAAGRSEDPYKMAGACILRADHSVASLGYNGAPSGVDIDWQDRDARRPLVVHAETNALRWVKPGDGALIATTDRPCRRCIVEIRAHGITRVVYDEEFWDDSTDIALELGVQLDHVKTPAIIDTRHLRRQRLWSEATFGPGPRTHGVLSHIRKELLEIEAEPLSHEWIDVVILALDGAWRAGHEPRAILEAIVDKQAINEKRTWPDWRGRSEDEAIEHDRTIEVRTGEAQ